MKVYVYLLSRSVYTVAEPSCMGLTGAHPLPKWGLEGSPVSLWARISICGRLPRDPQRPPQAGRHLPAVQSGKLLDLARSSARNAINLMALPYVRMCILVCTPAEMERSHSMFGTRAKSESGLSCILVSNLAPIFHTRHYYCTIIEDRSWILLHNCMVAVTHTEVRGWIRD